MKQNFYIWTAVAFFASTALVGCVVEESDAGNKDGGVAGKGSGGNGGTAGTGGGSAGVGATGGASGGTGATGGASGGTAGTGATGGATGGTGATAGSGGTGGGAACLDDTASTTVDCADLSFANTKCDDNGTEFPATGGEVCRFSAGYARPGVHEGVYNCLAAITGDPCSAAHDTAAWACYDDNFAAACDTTATQPVGGTCADIAASCPDAASLCDDRYDGYTSALQEQIATCYQAGTGECKADFKACTEDPYVNDAN